MISLYLFAQGRLHWCAGDSIGVRAFDPSGSYRPQRCVALPARLKSVPPAPVNCTKIQVKYAYVLHLCGGAPLARRAPCLVRTRPPASVPAGWGFAADAPLRHADQNVALVRHFLDVPSAVDDRCEHRCYCRTGPQSSMSDDLSQQSVDLRFLRTLAGSPLPRRVPVGPAFQLLLAYQAAGYVEVEIPPPIRTRAGHMTQPDALVVRVTSAGCAVASGRN